MLIKGETSTGTADYWRDLRELRDVPYEGLLTHGDHLRPLYLRIETVNICNNLCIICAYRDQERAKQVMDMELFKKAVTDYADLGGGFLSLTPLVGDVLLDRLLLDRLRYLKTVPEIRELGVTTNAVLASNYSEADLQFFVDSFNRISISIYGLDPDEYEKMTQRRNYDQMLEGVRRVILQSPRPLQMEFRLLKARSQEALYDWLSREVLPSLSPEEARKKARVNSSITRYANWGIYSEETTPLPHDAEWFASKYRRNRDQCLIPMFACMVFSSGNVSFCPCDNFDDTPELRLGSIRDSSLADLYNGEKIAKLWNWRKHGTPEFCRNCSFYIPLSTLQENKSILTDPHQIVGSG